MKVKAFCIGAISLVLAMTASAEEGRGRVFERARQTNQLVAVSFDPMSNIALHLGSQGRATVNSSFDLVSATCTDCGGGCPPVDRTVEVVLRAIEAVPAGYGISNLVITNWDITNVTQSTSTALSAGQTVTLTLVGDVLECANRFSLFMSVCEIRPPHAGDNCSICDSGDSDNDRILDCHETNTGIYVSPIDTGTDPANPDTDGDSILDGDEVLGTVAGLDLPAMGLNPLRSNILLEYDWFDDNLDSGTCAAHSHRPTPAALAMVTTAFANAPTTNPDGTTGITVIHDYGQGGPFTGGNFINDADGVLGQGVDGPDFQGHKASNFASNRNGYFHYVILPHRYYVSSGSSGQAQLPGDDMIVSLYCYGTDTNVGHTVMHELGHNLNIRHGGFENTNYKPNYNSVMNYAYQFPGVDNNCTPPGDGVLDYSRGALVSRPLNENSLDEPDGICGAPPWDWNGDADTTDVSLLWDINGDGVRTVLNDNDDWASVYYGGVNDADWLSEVISCENPPPKK